MKIFETGLYDYTDDPTVDVNKPVLYTPQFFEKMIVDVEDVPLDVEHDGKTVGLLQDISFEENCLNATPNTDIGDKSISPTFEYDTIDRGSYLEAVDGKFVSAGITETPRKLINNSYPNNEKKGEHMVSEEAFEQMSKQNRKLERELASKDNQLEANKSKLEKLDELEKKVKELEANNKKANDELDKVRPLADKYTAFENKAKGELVDEIANGNDALKEKIKDWDFAQLKTLKETRIVTEEPHGVTEGVAEGQNQGDGKKDSDEYTYDDFKEQYKAITGEEPKYA